MDQFSGDKYRLFQTYVEPLLIRKPSGHSEITILFDIAERAWKTGVKKEDIKAVVSYLNVCKKIYGDNPQVNRVNRDN